MKTSKEEFDKMDLAAEKLRELGVDKFSKMWIPPRGIDKKSGIKKLSKYLTKKYKR